MISPERLKMAREMRGWTQVELARRAKVTQGSIAQLEGGRIQPTSDLLETLAIQLGFLPSFFEQEQPIDFPLGSLLYRRRASMTAAQEKQTHRYGQLLFEITKRWAMRVKLPPVIIPRDIDDPVEAARATRSALGLSPNSPISNVVRAMERGGVLIVVLPLDIEQGDGFSSWAGANLDTPTIALWRVASGDRVRMTVAHELGHLVLPSHRAALAQSAILEDEAYRFAAEFLTPESAMREELVAPVTLAGLAELKPRWGVSIQALIRRAYSLTIISRRQYTYLMEQVSVRGWRTREPANLDIAIEKPRAFRKIAEVLYGDPLNYQRLGAELGLPTSRVKEIMSVHGSTADLVKSVPDVTAIPNNIRQFSTKKA